MAEAPNFQAIARRVLNVGNGPVLVAQLAEKLRSMWNARAVADIVRLEIEIPRAWTMAAPAGAITRALKALDR
jgi:hypothetical protein